ncbi:MAG: holo-ACP synthase [Elusimicrobia bacterium]|nr:holo-ACP synthase [Elusimicrobiota bacterium]
MKGIGIDIVEVKRFHGVSNRFLKRVFTEEEIKYCRKSAAAELHFAARFAAKEAVIKATTDRKIAMKDICVKNRKNGAPEVFVRGRRQKFFISISHTKTLAVAVVVLY